MELVNKKNEVRINHMDCLINNQKILVFNNEELLTFQMTRVVTKVLDSNSTKISLCICTYIVRQPTKKQKIIGHQLHVVYNERKQFNKTYHIYGYILIPDIFYFTQNFSMDYLKFPCKSKSNGVLS